MQTTTWCRAAVINELAVWGKLVRFSHSIFALPFAFSMALVVARELPASYWKYLVLLVCLVSARTLAMGFNRIVDRELDSANPRTAERELPRKAISVGSAWVLVGINSVIFIAGAALLGNHCLYLSPLVLTILLGYSLTKRFTSYSHLVLGLALALAPGGVWYALTAEWAFLPVWMMLGVAFWVAGFDILYSIADYNFDRTHGLFSVPAQFGIERALHISRALHLSAVVFLIIFGVQAQLGMSYIAGLLIFALLLASQHWGLTARSLGRLNPGFFARNGLASSSAKSELPIGTCGFIVLA